ncbi:MAG: site-specific DNA-methyltransferase [Candidatus Lokiarchaeota archaeon]|nr:site-specific DNA-methyltransferase [Candidatus Lokiarchaeota archaeon]
MPTDGKESSYEVVFGDVLETLPNYPEKFNLIIADPPFGLEFDKGSHEYGADDYILYDDKFSGDEYEEFSFKWISACHGALAKSGAMYVISGWTRVGEILNAVKRTRFHLINHIIWHFGWGVFARKRYVTSHYHVLFLAKDKNDYCFVPQFSNPNTKRKGEKYEEDVWYWPQYNRGNDPDRAPNHPCQISLAVLEKIVLISSKPGDWIGDVFSGSGGTILACRRLGRNVIGFEKKKEYESTIRQKAKFGEKIIPRAEKLVKKVDLTTFLGENDKDR